MCRKDGKCIDMSVNQEIKYCQKDGKCTDMLDGEDKHIWKNCNSKCIQPSDECKPIPIS